MRILGAVRLSNLTDETTSPERQREQIELYARLHDHVIVGIVEDLDVSGAVSPFDRPGLGPWLTQPAKLAAWDGICTSKLERFTRSLSHFDSFRDWADTHSKSYMSATESIDLTTSTGRMLANILAMFAQFQRERNAELRSEAASTIRKAGRWGGGVVPFGYEAQQEGVSWYLRLCDGACPLGLNLSAETRKMARAVIAGTPVREIVADLNRRKVPTSSDAQRLHDGQDSKGLEWRVSTVLQHLRSESLLGYVLHYKRGETPKRVYADGQVVKRAPLLDAGTWEQVQRALKTRSAPWNRTSVRASLITGVAFCAHCGGTLRKGRTLRKDRNSQVVVRGSDGGYNFYYQCANMRDRKVCPNSKSIPMDELDSIVNEAMMEYADEPYVTTIETPGHSSSVQVDKVERSIRELDFDDPEFAAKQAALLAERKRLQSAEFVPATFVTAPDGRTFGEVWEGMDTAGRRRYMAQRGIEIHAAREDDGSVVVTVGGGGWPGDVAKLGGITGEQYLEYVLP